MIKDELCSREMNKRKLAQYGLTMSYSLAMWIFLALAIGHLSTETKNLLILIGLIVLGASVTTEAILSKKWNL